MKALVLAGGEGLRLKPLLGALPKCLAPVQGRPFIEWQILLLKEQGFRQFVLCVGVGAKDVAGVLADGTKLGVSVEYSFEQTPLGTGGAIKNASGFVDGRFLCANGDTLAEFSVARMESRHEAAAASVSVLCRRAADATGKGTLVVGEDGRIIRFDEKKSAGASGLINCGFYLMEKKVLDCMVPGRPASLEKEVFPRLLETGSTVAAFETSGAFVDIGTPEEYTRVKDKGWR